MLGTRQFKRTVRPTSRKGTWRQIAFALALGAALVGTFGTVLRALVVGGQAYYLTLTNISILGIPVPISIGPLPTVTLPPTGGVVDGGLPAIDVGVPILGPTVFSTGVVQVHSEGDPATNVVLSRATGGQLDLFPVPILNTTGLLRAAAIEAECRLDANGLTTHAAVAGIESTLLPAGALNQQLWADPPPNTGLTIAGLGAVFLHEVTKTQVGNLTVYGVNALRIGLNASAIPAGGATGDVIIGHVECAAERPIPTGVSPASGDAGTVVTITGTGFRPDATVDFAGVPATSATYVSPTEITATVPVLLGGTWHVSVTTPVDRGTVAAAFTSTNPLPGLLPTGVAGQAFGVQTSLMPPLPLGPIGFGPRPVAVLPEGGGRTTDRLADLAGLPGGELVPGGLLITGLMDVLSEGSPATMTQRSVAEIAGANLGAGLLAADVVRAQCQLGPTGLTGSSNLAGLTSSVLGDLSAFVNAAPNTGLNVPGLGSLILNEQTSSFDAGTGRRTLSVNALHLTVSPLGVPLGDLVVGHAECSALEATVSSIAPPSGPESGGTPVTITGTGFGGATTVTFGGAPATGVTVQDPTQITAITPAHAPGAVDVVIASPLGARTAPAGFTYVGIGDLQVTIGGPASAPPGSTVAYTIQVSNVGSLPATAVVVDLPTPPGLTFVSTSGACVTALPCNLGTIAPGTAATIVATFSVPADYAGPNPISATVTTASPDDPAAGNNSQTLQTPVLATSSISVQMTVDNPSPHVGDVVTFTVTATNDGPLAATGVQIVDKLPPGLTLQTATPIDGTTYDADTGAWDIPTLPTGPGATLQLTALVTTPGLLTNSATKTAGNQYDPDTSDNIAAVALNAGPTADLRVSMTASASSGPAGTPILFTIEVTNTGPNTATGIVINDLIPSGLTFSSASDSLGVYDAATGNWTIDSLPGQVSAQLVLTATIDAVAPVTNVARKVAQAEFDPAPGNDRAEATINGQSADLQLVMTFEPTDPTPGSPVTITLTLTNNGPDAASNAVVQRALPGGLTFVSFMPPDQGTYDPATNVWSVGAMPPFGPDGTAVLRIVGTLPASGPTTDAPRVSGDPIDPDPTNNSPGPLVLPPAAGAPDLLVQVSRTGDLTLPGSPVTIQVDIRNIGTASSTGPISPVVTLPSNVSITSHAPPAWICSPQGNAYPCTRADLQLAPGASTSLTLTGTVTAAGSNDTPVVVVVPHPDDLDPSNNTAIFPAAPGGPEAANLVVTQSATQAPPGVLTIAFTVRNDGPGVARGVTLVDALPPGVTLISAAASVGTCGGTTTIVCNLGDLAPGAQATGTIVLQLPPAGIVTHTLSASSASADPDPADNVSTITVGVQGPATPGDSDGDGMSDECENRFGLDPATNDAAGDPDGDGASNLRECTEGTHPRGFVQRYYAEGANGTFFDTRYAMFNTDPVNPARVLVRLLLDTGATSSRAIAIPALGRAEISSDDVLGTFQGAFSAIVEADGAIATARTMSWDDGGYGLSLESLASQPSNTWYFAEGATHGPFVLFYLIENPSLTETAHVEARFLTSTGVPVVRTYAVAASSRFTINVDEIPGLEAADVAASFASTNGVGVVVERAMYANSADRVFEAGHAVAGVNAPATNWFMAETATGVFFNAFVLMANPNTTATTATVTYLLPDGTSFDRPYTIAPTSRITFNVAEQDPRLAGTSVSMSVISTQPIVVERAMWWPTPALSPFWYGGHASMSSTATATRWAVPAGANGGGQQEQTYLLIANQGGAAADVQVSIVFDDGTRALRTLSLGPSSRTTLNIGVDIAEAAERPFSILVESLGAMPAPLVVDVSRYRSTPDQFWAAGGSAPGIPVPLVP